MATEDWTNDELDDYYDQVVGTEIVAVRHDPDGIWIHLSNGTMIEVAAETVGFSVDIHLHDDEMPSAPAGLLLGTHGHEET